MEMWIQGALFGDGEKVVKRQVLGSRRVKHMGWLPVTRDPEVAVSHGESHRNASDFRIGLARALGQIPPETRMAIRRAVDPTRRDAAA